MLASGFLVGCQDNIEFTRKPIEKAQSGERPTVRTPIFVVARADGAFLKSEAAGRSPERVMRIRRRLPRAACVEKNGRTRCVSARVTGTVLQQGDITMAGATDGFALKIPMAYRFDVKGTGVARDVDGLLGHDVCSLCLAFAPPG